MAEGQGGAMFWIAGGVVMLLLLVAIIAFFSVVVSVWLRLFAGVALNGAGVVARLGVAVGAMALVSLLMGWRRRL